MQYAETVGTWAINGGIRALEDHDGDGIGDYLVVHLSSPSLPAERGYSILSGATGELIRFIPNYYGVQQLNVEVIGDQDGDGYQDFVVMVSGLNFGFDGERFVVRNSVNGALISVFDVVGESFSLNTPPYRAGDYNGDGVDEFAIVPSDGRVWIVSLWPTASVVHDISYPSFGSLFFGLVPLQDLDGDGTDDFALGWPSPGLIEVRSGSTGALLNSVAGTGPFNPYLQGLGWGLTRVSDIDGDGFDDLAAPDHWLSRVVAFSSATLDEIWSHRWAAPSVEAEAIAATPFGIAFHRHFASGGDVNGDGYDDIVGHTFVINSFGTSQQRHGVLDVLSGLDGTMIHRVEGEDIAFDGCVEGGPEQLRIADDFDGDGRAEILWYDRDFAGCGQFDSLERGLLIVFKGMPGGFAQPFCTPTPNSTGVPATLTPYGPPTEGTPALHFELTDAPQSMPCQLTWGPPLAPGMNGVVGPWGELCFDPAGAQRYGVPQWTGLDGTAVFEIDWDTWPVASHWLGGTTWVAQVMFRDSANAGHANTSNAIEFVVNGR